MIIKKDNKNFMIPEPYSDKNKRHISGYNCYLCGRPAEHKHHIIYGTGKRKISEREGLTLALCSRCHWNIHHKHEHDNELKAMAQEEWLKKHNNDRQKWYSLFYKFYDN